MVYPPCTTQGRIEIDKALKTFDIEDHFMIEEALLMEFQDVKCVEHQMLNSGDVLRIINKFK